MPAAAPLPQSRSALPLYLAFPYLRHQHHHSSSSSQAEQLTETAARKPNSRSSKAKSKSKSRAKTKTITRREDVNDEMDTLRYQVAPPCNSSGAPPLAPSSSPSPSMMSRDPEKTRKRKYKEPENPLAALLWRLQLWLSVTFALSVMEPWEKLLVVVLVGVIFGLMFIGLIRFLPQFIAMSIERTRYYLLG